MKISLDLPDKLMAEIIETDALLAVMGRSSTIEEQLLAKIESPNHQVSPWVRSLQLSRDGSELHFRVPKLLHLLDEPEKDFNLRQVETLKMLTARMKKSPLPQRIIKILCDNYLAIVAVIEKHVEELDASALAELERRDLDCSMELEAKNLALEARKKREAQRKSLDLSSPLNFEPDDILDPDSIIAYCKEINHA